MCLVESTVTLPALLTWASSPPPLFLATALLISTTWLPIQWMARCIFRTPAAGRCLRWNHCMLLRMWPRTWSWWQELVTSVYHMMTLAAGMEEKLLRPLSLTREVLYGCYNNHCSMQSMGRWSFENVCGSLGVRHQKIFYFMTSCIPVPFNMQFYTYLDILALDYLWLEFLN